MSHCKSNSSYSCYKPAPQPRQSTDLAATIFQLNIADVFLIYFFRVTNNGPIMARNTIINGTFSDIGPDVFPIEAISGPGIFSLNIGDVQVSTLATPFVNPLVILYSPNVSSAVTMTVSSNTPDYYLPNNSAESSFIGFADRSVASNDKSVVSNVKQVELRDISSGAERNELIQLLKDNHPDIIQLIKDKYPDVDLS